MSRGMRMIDGGDPIRQQAAVWFARLRSDDVTDAQTQRWQAWLDADPAHRRAYERIERLWSGLGTYAHHPDIARRLESFPVGPAGVRGRRNWRPWAGAAAAAAVAVLAVTLWAMVRPAGIQPVDYVTAIGEHRNVVLEDGTRVALDTNSRVSVAYSDDARDIRLTQGRAFFDTGSDPRPLTIHTTLGSVRAIGTRFEVYRQPGAVEVSLIEGRLLLLPAEASAAGGPTPMQAGQRARFNADPSALRIESVKPELPAWLSGRLVFTDASLDEVISEFSRYSRQTLVLDGHGLDGIRISGVFRNDGLQAFLGALADAYPISVDASEPGVLRLRPADARSTGDATR